MKNLTSIIYEYTGGNKYEKVGHNIEAGLSVN
jgi:hypothetical protein